MGRTKKVGSAGRFGPRYGKRIRKMVTDIEKQQKKYYECPQCCAERVKRVSTSIFSCRKCSHTFVGKAYYPK